MNRKKNFSFNPKIALLALLVIVVVVVVVYNFNTGSTINDIQSTAFTQTASGEISKTSIAFITAGLGKGNERMTDKSEQEN